MDLLHESIADIQEREFVDKLLNNLHYRWSLFNIKGMELKGALLKPEVELRHYRKGLIGDIDVLVVPADHPECTTAIQIKRFPVKVGLEKHTWVRPRMQKLFDEGVRQANYAARKVGFSQVYLWLFVLADTRELNNGRYTYDGPDSRLLSEINYVMSPTKLDPRIGIVKFDWTQAMDRPPLELCASGGHLERLAERTEQPAELTEWARSLTVTAKDLAITSRR